MKNKLGFSTVLACMFTLILSVFSCNDETTDDNGSAPSTNGKLTITGLEKYNGNYVFAQGGTESVYLLAGDDVSLLQEKATGSKISDGSVTLKVWQWLETNQLVSYSGNNQNTKFSFGIYSTVNMSNENQIAQGEIETVNFNNGVGNGVVSSIRPTVVVDIGNGIKIILKAYKYGPYPNDSREHSIILLGFNSYSVRKDNYDNYMQDFEVKVNGNIITFAEYEISISGGDIRFSSSFASNFIIDQEYTIQIKYTANSSRKIKVWVPKGNDDYWEPSGAFNILNSFDTGEKTIVAARW